MTHILPRDPDGTLVTDPTQHVEKILESYEKTFGSKPKKVRPPFEESDHPELDTSELCNNIQICHYLTLIGWVLAELTLLHLSWPCQDSGKPKNWTFETCSMNFWLFGILAPWSHKAQYLCA